MSGFCQGCLERVAESQSPVQYFESAAEKNNKAGLLDFKALERVVQEMTFKLMNYACAPIRTEWCLSRIMQMKIMCSGATVFLYLEILEFPLALPISNMSPERGVRKIKLINRGFKVDLRMIC